MQANIKNNRFIKSTSRASGSIELCSSGCDLQASTVSVNAPGPLRGITTLLLVAGVSAAAVTGASGQDAPLAATSPWKFSASAAVKETYDNNIYLQSVTPLANRESFVTTVMPSVGIAYKSSDAFVASLSYTPEVNVFHSEPEEDFSLHRVLLNLTGKSGQTAWEIANTFVAIDGSDIAPTYSGPGGSPATGGVAVRDRRDAMVERGQFKLTHTMGDWFLRPVVAGYLHDFQMVQKNAAGYQNYADRDDLNGGLDAGRSVGKATWLVAGYRYGAQQQAQVFPAINPVHYDSTYHRALFGLEGQPWNWLKFALSLGPEFRRYGGVVAPGFADVDETYLYVDSSLTLTPTKADTITLSAKRFEQPGMGGRSAYVDGTYDLAIRHKLSEKFTVGCGVRGYNTDFLEPVLRQDWIVSANGLVSYTFNKNLNAEVSYAYESGMSDVPDTSGREYTRSLFALGVKYVFK